MSDSDTDGCPSLEEIVKRNLLKCSMKAAMYQDDLVRRAFVSIGMEDIATYAVTHCSKRMQRLIRRKANIRIDQHEIGTEAGFGRHGWLLKVYVDGVFFDSREIFFTVNGVEDAKEH